MELRVHSYEKKHLKKIHRSLAECTVLLKSNGDFPLDQPGKIALFGNGARKTIKGGTGSGEVNSRFQITIEQGLELAGFEITTKDWLDSYDNLYEAEKAKFIHGLQVEARKRHTLAIMAFMGAIMPEPEHHLPLEGEGDTAIYVLGRISGEGSDRNPAAGDILLTESERRDILRLQKTYKKFMLVLNVGGPVDLSPVAEVENILLLSQLGVETGSIFADILLGKEVPSGKLATTWTGWGEYPVVGEFGDRDNTRYMEGIYVGYRYFDSVGCTPAFPFGFGLGYTTFQITDVTIHLEGEVVSVQADVTNTGSFKGKEVLQVYVSVPEGRLDQPFQTLAAWKKTSELAPGQREQLQIRFAMSELASYDADAEAYILEPGNYVIHVGTSSRDHETYAVVKLSEMVIVKKTRNALGECGFIDWKPDSKNTLEIPAVPVLTLEPGVITTQTCVYDQPEDMDWQVAALTDEELIHMNVGHFNLHGGPANVIGESSTSVAGAAGETSHILETLNEKPLVMADGPAGLRLSRQSFTDKKGNVYGTGPAIPETMAELMPTAATAVLNYMKKKPRRGQRLKDQYCTAIPIGTAIAQSWNLEFAETCGDIVGTEMEMFDVDLWLAPALNIHRSIRCGRNFEYYSEDPRISGMMAAAITLGVQKHPGRAVTIKHFAANNQETNRYNNNSLVSERAMREIYLKGFEICVREAAPMTVMTSYNLLNGTHTSEHRGLIQDILRTEYGFDGVVMTDWVVNGGTMDKTSIHPAPRAALVARAGGDLFMPGSMNDIQDIRKGLHKKEVSSEQLAINASRLYTLSRKLRLAREEAKTEKKDE